jgi:hypothetical protein
MTNIPTIGVATSMPISNFFAMGISPALTQPLPNYKVIIFTSCFGF